MSVFLLCHCPPHPPTASPHQDPGMSASSPDPETRGWGCIPAAPRSLCGVSVSLLKTGSRRAFWNTGTPVGKAELRQRAGEIVLTAQRSTGSGVWRLGSVPGLATEIQRDAGQAGFPFVTGQSHGLSLAPDSGPSTPVVFYVLISSLLGPPGLCLMPHPPPHSSLGRGHGWGRGLPSLPGGALSVI